MTKPTLTVQRTIEFSDTDAAGLVHFSNYFRYMETAERVFFEQAGLPLFDGTEKREGFPRVEASCSYNAPLRFGDEVLITLTLERVRSCALHYSFTFSRINGEESPQAVATGQMTTVFSRVDAGSGQVKAQAIPDDWLQKLGWK